MRGIRCSIVAAALASGKARLSDTANYTSGTVHDYRSIRLPKRHGRPGVLAMWNSHLLAT